MSHPWQPERQPHAQRHGRVPPPSPQGYITPPRPPRRKHQGWIIAGAVVAALLVLGAIGSALGKPAPAAKTAAAAVVSAAPSPEPCRQQVTTWKQSRGWTDLRHVKFDAATLTRLTQRPVGLRSPVRGHPDHPRCAPGPRPPAAVLRRPARLLHECHDRVLTVSNGRLACPLHRSPVAGAEGVGIPSQAGDYCRDSDQGMTGVAGDGESIICEDNDGCAGNLPNRPLPAAALTAGRLSWASGQVRSRTAAEPAPARGLLMLTRRSPAALTWRCGLVMKASGHH